MLTQTNISVVFKNFSKNKIFAGAIFTVVLSLTQSTFAHDAAYCKKVEGGWANIPYGAYNQNNQLGFINPAGYLQMGLCWWHSLFQRSMLYLAVFKPELPKPDRREAIKIITKLISQDRVVEIPGYENISSFSVDWHSEIESALSQWQIIDGFIRQKWVQNLSENTWTTPDALLSKMKKLEKEVNQYHRMPWAMLKMPAVEAHAWLIVEFNPKATGYELKYVDSNFNGQVRTAWYSFGSQSISTDYYGNVTLTIGYEEFYPKAQAAIKKYCEN